MSPLFSDISLCAQEISQGFAGWLFCFFPC